jgi:hypothetical protein
MGPAAVSGGRSADLVRRPEGSGEALFWGRVAARARWRESHGGAWPAGLTQQERFDMCLMVFLVPHRYPMQKLTQKARA